MAVTRIIYVCETCLSISNAPGECHGTKMLKVDAGEPGSERSKPIIGEEGRLKSHAPRWWVERRGPLGEASLE